MTDDRGECIAQAKEKFDLLSAKANGKSHVPGDSHYEILLEDLLAEQVSIDAYGQIIQVVGDDAATARLVPEPPP